MKNYFQIVCLFALLYSVFAFTDADKKVIARICLKRTNATTDDLQIFLKDVEELQKTRTQYCILACYYKVTKTMDETNKFIYENIISELEPIKKEDKELYEKFDHIFKDCIFSSYYLIVGVAASDQDECEVAKKYIDCITKKAKDVNINKIPITHMLTDGALFVN